MIVAFLSSPAISFGDGTFIAWGWIILTAIFWSLIPGVFILKAVMERDRRRVWAETQPAIDAGLAEIRKESRYVFCSDEWGGTTVSVTMACRYAADGSLINAWQVEPMAPDTPAWVRERYEAWKKAELSQPTPPPKGP